MGLPSTPAARLARALSSLEGLSVGDGFGQRFFGDDGYLRAERRELPPPVWQTTDDTEMAIAIVDVLERAGRIDQDRLARAFAARFSREPDRGYGSGAYGLLSVIRNGLPWHLAAPTMFGGQGSRGNGAAMRVAPLGAYSSDDLDAVVAEARSSAEVTHAHPDGVAGAIAVAVAAAWVANSDLRNTSMLDLAIRRTPAGETRQGLIRAASLLPGSSVELAANALGTGKQVLASDTVPFALWAASSYLENFEEALWRTVSGLGDRDTTCAIVGGIIGVEATIPTTWVDRREPLRRDLEA